MFIDATDLEQWSNRLEARSTTPQVIRRLLHGTIKKVKRSGFRAGEGTQFSGWDGIVEVEEGNAFVPDGLSAWEIGTGRNIKSKANDDYSKRTENPNGVTPSKTTFIFVTSRRWSEKDKWIEEKNREGIWAKVQAYDADDLEEWLELAPSVHAWLSQLIGKMPPDVQDLEDYFEDWCHITSPITTAELVLAGRQKTIDKLNQWIGNPPSSLVMVADTREEVISVLASIIQQLPEEQKESLLSKSIVIKNESSWQQLTKGHNDLLLLPTFDDPPSISRIVKRGHHVLIPIGREANTSANTFEIEPLGKEQAIKALVSMGLTESEASSKANESRCSLSALRRLFATNPETEHPKWSQPEEGNALVPIILVGAWDENKETDRQALQEIARKPYNDILTTITRWANDSDPPIRCVRGIWQIISREDSWQLISRYITSDDLNVFERVALGYLGSKNPLYELEPEEQHFANILGKEFSHSEHLRKGLVETLALLGTRPVSSSNTSISFQECAKHIVYKLLNNADWVVWSSFSPHLPLLAEAAPETFLEAVEENLFSDDLPILKLFRERGVLGATSSHTDLLWALEGLAWNEELLARIAILLAKLARLDPGGKLSNRPINSLIEIFKLWHPQTSASTERRLSVLSTLSKREPDVGWQLNLSLIPKKSDIAHPTHKPRWREWSEKPVTNIEYWQCINALVDTNLNNVGKNVKRWQDVLDQLGDFPIPACNKAIDKFLELDYKSFNKEDKLALWNKLRSLVHKHRAFQIAKWALPKDIVDKLYSVYQKLEPNDLINRYSWLFSLQPEIPEISTHDHKEQMKEAEKLRQEAARKILDEYDPETFLELAQHIDEPYWLGFYVGAIDNQEKLGLNFLSKVLESKNTNLLNLGRGYIGERISHQDSSWLNDIIVTNTFGTWNSWQKGNFFLSTRANRQTLTWLEAQEQEVQSVYWKHIQWNKIEKEVTQEAISELLNYKRPYVALDLVTYRDRQGESEETSETVLIEILEQIAQSINHGEISSDRTMFQYHLAKVFKKLAASPNVDQEKFLKLEWIFLPLFEYSEYKPVALQQELRQNPKFFAEILTWIFKAEDETKRSPETITEEERDRGHNAYELLNIWHRIPGLQDDGKIDSAQLRQWIIEARLACHNLKRTVVGDQQIGQVLAHSPIGQDNVWPTEEVRDIIEEIASAELETGIRIGVYNKRGVTTRSLSEGGQQEKSIAKQYIDNASKITDKYPRTAAMLRKLANDFEHEAKQHDVDAKLNNF